MAKKVNAVALISNVACRMTSSSICAMINSMYSVSIAYLLWLFSGFGALGLHRFYLGKIPTGILWMLTGGLGMVGSIYDFFTLPGQVNEANIRSEFLNSSYRQYRREEPKETWRYASDAQYRTVNEE